MVAVLSFVIFLSWFWMRLKNDLQAVMKVVSVSVDSNLNLQDGLRDGRLGQFRRILRQEIQLVELSCQDMSF